MQADYLPYIIHGASCISTYYKGRFSAIMFIDTSMALHAPDIRFPGLGIEIQNLPSGFTLPIGNGFEIHFYGSIIMMGFLLGYLMACHCGKKEGISADTLMDFLIYVLIFSILGARIYYVVFSWEDYKDNLLQVFNIRGGGLAIYGGIIASVITCAVYCKVKKMKFYKLADCCMPGIFVGQILGRWGNFFNCEAFGGYTDGFLAMWIRRAKVYAGYISQDLADHIQTYDGEEYISVHPTFLYESLWNLACLGLILLIYRHKKFDGQIFWTYLLLYGLGRVWIEGLRTDQLQIGSTGLAVSQLLSGTLIVISIIVQVLMSRRSASHPAG